MQGRFLRCAGLPAKFLLPLSELGIVSALVSHYPADIQKIMLSESLKTLQDTVAFLAKIHSRESNKDTFKENRRQLEDSKRGPPHDGDCDSGTNRRQDLRQMRHVRNVHNGNSIKSPCRHGANSRMQNYQQNERRSTSQPSGRRSQAPEFQTRTSDARRQERYQSRSRSGMPTCTYIGKLDGRTRGTWKARAKFSTFRQQNE
jgi:hypothetical protein